MKRFVYAFLATICSLSSLSFADGRSDQERFNEELSRLGSDFDKRQEVGEGESGLYLSNSLSKEDKARFKPYVTKQSNGLLSLSDNIYKVFPVSSTVIDPSNPFPGVGGGDTISPWKPPVNGNLPGLPTVATLTALTHEDFEENQKKIDFVNSNISLMNDLTSQGYGTIDEEGTFQASSNDHYIQQDFIMNFRIEWGAMKFTANYFFTMLLGVLGISVNLSLVKDIYDLLNKNSDDFLKLYSNIGTGIFSEFSSFVENKWLSGLADLASATAMLINLLKATTVAGWIFTVIQYVASHYLPGLIKGVLMVFGSHYFHYGADVEIGIWWSNYYILNRVVY